MEPAAEPLRLVHRRPGHILADVGQEPQSHNRVGFWGEWEAEADIVESFRQLLERDEPEMCVRPHLTAPSVSDGSTAAP